MMVLYPASDLLNQGSVFAMPMVLIAGVIAGLSPCCIAIYPAAAAVYHGASSSDVGCGISWRVKGHGVKNAVAFLFGIAATTTALGIIAALAGRIVGQLGPTMRYSVAAVPLLMGLHLIGWLRLPITTLPCRVIQNDCPGAFGAGLFLSLALTPCGTPVLASVLAYAVFKGTVAYAAILLFLYGVGSGLPVVLVGATADRLLSRLGRAGYGVWTERITGGAVMTLALVLLWRA